MLESILRKKVPKSGHVHGPRTRRTTGTMWHPTPKRASGNERAIKKGGRGATPRDSLRPGFLLEKAWIPRPGPGGNPPRRCQPAPVQTRTTYQGQPGAAYPLGGVPPKPPWGAAPRGPRLPGGGPHFSREMGRKRAGGKPPGPPVFMARLLPLARFWDRCL